jgi:hypothetical protein
MQDDPTLNLRQRHGRLDVYPAPATTFQRRSPPVASEAPTQAGGGRHTYVAKRGDLGNVLGMAFAVEVGPGFGPDRQADQLAGLAASKSPSLKWMPPYSREMPAWSAAAVKDFHDRVTGLAGRAQLHARAAVPDLSSSEREGKRSPTAFRSRTHPAGRSWTIDVLVRRLAASEGVQVRRPLPKWLNALLPSWSGRRSGLTSVSAGQRRVGGRDRV